MIIVLFVCFYLILTLNKDSCPGCSLRSGDALDLSHQAFADIVFGWDKAVQLGIIRITWDIVSCDTKPDSKPNAPAPAPAPAPQPIEHDTVIPPVSGSYCETYKYWRQCSSDKKGFHECSYDYKWKNFQACSNGGTCSQVDNNNPNAGIICKPPVKAVIYASNDANPTAGSKCNVGSDWRVCDPSDPSRWFECSWNGIWKSPVQCPSGYTCSNNQGSNHGITCQVPANSAGKGSLPVSFGFGCQVFCLAS